MSSERFWIVIAGLSGALAVSAEAAARHLLAQDPYRLDLAATGGRYGLVHALALLLAAALAPAWASGAARHWLAAAGWCFVAGLILFCGSLYGLALGAPIFLARLTPIGGVAFIAGWLALAFAALSPRPAR
ncbi:MAG TPA: DUF423 domain-containing protein [Stellaceae bacterium]|nr:DUF423 domain-containing protein [Stellaceae bacterium]